MDIGWCGVSYFFGGVFEKVYTILSLRLDGRDKSSMDVWHSNVELKEPKSRPATSDVKSVLRKPMALK